MRIWIRRLASMKIAVVLLILIVMALATGTIVESARGSEAAAIAVYKAAWFRALLAAFALNLAFSLIDRWPFGRDWIGFALTHGSMLLILVGALVTDRLKVEGQLALWEGEQSATIAAAQGPGDGRPQQLFLPFSIRLDAFEIDYYQGTRRPAMFRSRVTVEDPARGRRFPAVIEMNRELSYAGYKLFQSGYQQGAERDQSVLLVSRDPGQPIVFAGYVLLLAGMMTVLVTRVAQHKALARKTGPPADRQLRRVAAALVACVLAALLSPALAATLPDEATTETLRRLPVQHDGRVMPLDTLAREATWKVTGRARLRGIDPTALVLGWTFDPNGWSGEPLVKIGGASFAAAIGLPPSARYAAYRDLARNERLMRLIEEARATAEEERPVRGEVRDAQRLEERLSWMQGFLDRKSLTVLPQPHDPNAPWAAPPTLRDPSDLIAILNSGEASAYAPPNVMGREVTYNRVRPSRLAWWTLGAGLLASLLAGDRRRRFLHGVAVAGLVAGFAVMTWGIATRWSVAGRIPASNMYESLLFLGWGVGLFALVALPVPRSTLVVQNATAMAALTMALADLLPIDPFIHPMPPVLSGTAWLAIHVPIIMLSYSVLALGVCVAHMRIAWEIARPARRDVALRLSETLYWYIHAGSILLIAGILTGSVWAASSWGRYWGWDPKEVWSLIAFLAYVAILHGRFDRMIGTFGVAALSIVAFWTILMTYVGVNFVLTAGLHSYGFGGAAVVRWLLIIAAVEGLFLTLGLLAHRAHRMPLAESAP